jgi:c-di-GMP-related signal transduction protein
MNADDHTSAGSESLREVFLGRQPILDKDQALAGYELLFRTTANGDNPVGDPRAATADVVCKAFAQLGLPNVLGLVRAFINVDASFLSEDVIELLPKDMVVFEVDVAALTDPAAVARCRELKEHGYQFVISGLTTVTDTLRPLLDLATYLKVDVNSMPVDQLQSVAAELKTTRRTLVACRVESQNQMELCALLGFQLFQGYYFAKPDIIEGRTLDASTHGLFRLIQLIAEDAEVDEIETAFRTEPALVVNLLRLTNSVGVGARVRISSVRHAITVIGRRQLQRWLQLLLFSRGNAQGFARNPLMQYAALRGRFMELLAEKLFPAYREMRDPAFITGLMSVMPAALGMTIENILTQITVDNDVRLALLDRQGALGSVLALTERYDDNDVPGVQALLAAHPGQHIGFLADVLAMALQWVQQLDTDTA